MYSAFFSSVSIFIMLIYLAFSALIVVFLIKAMIFMNKEIELKQEQNNLLRKLADKSEKKEQ